MSAAGLHIAALSRDLRRAAQVQRYARLAIKRRDPVGTRWWTAEAIRLARGIRSRTAAIRNWRLRQAADQRSAP